jgi:fluoroacetyl-CoA thioesterase
MKASLRPGTATTRRIIVDSTRTIDFIGEEGQVWRVYSTEWLVRDVERTCLDFILEHADAGENSVGTEVALQYLALTLLGMEVEITATVNAVEGRRVSFSVSIKDNLEPICVGSHIRFVIDTAKTIERVKAKAAKHAARSAS